jgi:hypothetical protein
MFASMGRYNERAIATMRYVLATWGWHDWQAPGSAYSALPKVGVYHESTVPRQESCFLGVDGGQSSTMALIGDTTTHILDGAQGESCLIQAATDALHGAEAGLCAATIESAAAFPGSEAVSVACIDEVFHNRAVRRHSRRGLGSDANTKLIEPRHGPAMGALLEARQSWQSAGE